MASGARDRPHRPGTATLKFRKATLNPRPAREVGAPAGHPPLPAAGLAQPSPLRGTSPGPKGRQAYLTLQADLHGINCRHFVAAVLGTLGSDVDGLPPGSEAAVVTPIFSAMPNEMKSQGE